MNIKLKNLSCCLFIIFIMGFYTLNGSSVYRESMRFMILIGIALCFITVVLSFKINLRTLIFILFLSGIILCLYYIRNDTRLMVALLAILCALNIEPEKITTYLFYTKLAFFTLVMCLGEYGHINGCALHGGMLILLYVCMQKKSICWKKYFCILLVYLLLILYTDSGSVKVGIGAMLTLLLIEKTKVGKKLLCSKILIFIFPICLFLNLFFVIGIGENQIPVIGEYVSDSLNEKFLYLCEVLDDFTTSRLTLGNYSLKMFGISLWGGNVNYSLLDLAGGNYFNLDSGFMWLVQGWGIVMTVVFMILTCFLMKYFINTKKYYYIIAGIVIALWAINEDMLVSFGFNFLIIFMGQAVNYCLSKRRRMNEYSENNPLLLVWKKSYTGKS